MTDLPNTDGNVGYLTRTVGTLHPSSQPIYSETQYFGTQLDVTGEFPRTFVVQPDMEIVIIGGVKYLYPEVKVAFLGWFVEDGKLPDGSPFFRLISKPSDIVTSEDVLIKQRTDLDPSFLTRDEFSFINTSFVPQAGKTYYLGVVVSGAYSFGGPINPLSGKFVVAPTSQFSNVDFRETIDSRYLQTVNLDAPPPSKIPTTGDDAIILGDGADTLFALAGNDTISGGEGNSYLRGDEGDDFIGGGNGFDDINGNQGNDTIATGGGDDYCVGGKDNDSLDGGAGYDLVYGNLGNDTCEGGDGNDIVRGGQDNDVVRGGTGNDFVSGDKGDDTMTGGAGADIFHTFGDAGIDRVTDFSLAQGDRVQLDPGTQFTVSQVGADTVINMTGGGQMILVGVQMSTLTPGWIFGN